MSRAAKPFVVLSLALVLTVIPNVNKSFGQDGHEEFWKVLRTVQDILAGKNTEQANDVIGRKADLIYGTRLENLRSVVAGEIKTCSLADTSYHGVMVQGQTNPSEDMGFIVLKTQKADTTKVRFHTVVFMKDSTGQFKIHLWQTGESIK